MANATENLTRGGEDKGEKEQASRRVWPSTPLGEIGFTVEACDALFITNCHFIN